MTIEEAVEIVLKGRSHEPCSNCHGERWLDEPAPKFGKRHLGVKSPRTGWSRDMPASRRACAQCNGSGKTTRPEFAEAQTLLGGPRGD